MKKYLSILVIVVLMVSALAGCGNGTATNGDSGGNGGNVSGESFTWVYQSTWVEGSLNHGYAKMLADDITAATGGRLTINTMATGAIVSAFDVLDAVSKGTLDAAHVWLGYWLGQIEPLGLYASMPAGMTYEEYMMWQTAGEGVELLQELFDNNGYNIHVLSIGSISSEILYHSKVPIRKAEDIKNLKVRGVGIWGDIQTRMGASVVALDASEIYSALERGVADAIEYANPSINWDAGFHEIAKYLVVPGIHQSSSSYHMLINKDKWNALPDDLKSMLETVGTAQWAKVWSASKSADSKAWEKFLQAEKDGKIEIIYLPSEEQQKFADVALEYYAEKSKQNAEFAKIYNSQKAFMDAMRPLGKAMTPSYD